MYKRWYKRIAISHEKINVSLFVCHTVRSSEGLALALDDIADGGKGGRRVVAEAAKLMIDLGES